MGTLANNPYIMQSAGGIAGGILGGATQWMDLNKQREMAGNLPIPTEAELNVNFDPLKDVDPMKVDASGKPIYSGMSGEYTEITKFDPKKNANTLMSQYQMLNPMMNSQGQYDIDTKGMVGQSALGMAGKGAGAGAGIGTLIAPGIGTAIGAGIGALAGGIAGFFKGKKTKKQIEQRESDANQRLREAGFDSASIEARLRNQQRNALDRFRNMQASFNQQLGQYDEAQDMKASQTALIDERRRRYQNIGRY